MIEKCIPDCKQKSKIKVKIKKEAQSQPSCLGVVSGSVCPKCGCTDYDEWEELEYEKGGDDPLYGGALVPMKFTRCGECD